MVGDLDTVDKKVLEEYQNQPDIEFEIHKPEKDETDTELALLTAARQGCEAVDILGALGGRMDHAIGNIQLMYQFFCQGMEVNIYDARNRLYLLGGHKVFHREEVYGKYISFLPMTETVEGLTLRGFKYPLQRRTIGWGRVSASAMNSNGKRAFWSWREASFCAWRHMINSDKKVAS